MNLTQYALGGIFSPEAAPGATRRRRRGGTRPPQSVASPPPFNLNTISQGVSTADFYLAVPAAVRALPRDRFETKLIAKPQLRGTEGTKLTLNLGDEVPVPSTVFTPIADGRRRHVNPLTSFNYKPVGVNIEMTPRVTFDGDIILELLVESSTLGPATSTSPGQNLPSFGSRKVTTKLRLREGESNLLAGLLREDERRSLRGFPGVLRLPILSSCSPTTTVDQPDRHRHAAHAAHRPDARADRAGSRRRSTSARSRTSASVDRRRSSRRRGAEAGCRPASGRHAGPAVRARRRAGASGPRCRPGPHATRARAPASPGVQPRRPPVPPAAPARSGRSAGAADGNTARSGTAACRPHGHGAAAPAQVLCPPPGTECVGGGPYTVPFRFRVRRSCPRSPSR